MYEDSNQCQPQVRTGPITWLNVALKNSVEKAVEEYLGHSWHLLYESDYSEFACHRCAIVSDGSFSVFFKYSEDAQAERQFAAEMSCLLTVSKLTGVLIPELINIVSVTSGTLLLMRALVAVNRGAKQWREIGRTLARIHRITGDKYGFERNGFWGPLHQDNTPTSSWAEFFRERRLLPLLQTAIASGNIPQQVASDVENIIPRLPDLCGPDVTPTLLHGDAQQNNFVSTAEGAYVIDPAVYYGHPEMDLALIDSWQPVPDAVFDGYRDELPIDKDFRDRRYLWRIPLYLAAVTLEGPGHLPALIKSLSKNI